MDKKGIAEIGQMHRFQAALQLGDDVFSVRLLVKEFAPGKAYVDRAEVRKLYHHRLEKRMPTGTSERASIAENPSQPAVGTYTIRELLTGVKDSKGNYFFRPAPEQLRGEVEPGGAENAPTPLNLRGEAASMPPIKSTAHETGVSALPRANTITPLDDFKYAKGGDRGAARRLADNTWTPQQTRELAARLDPGQETVFIPVPSSTGRNQLPGALAKKLAAELGGTYVDYRGMYESKGSGFMKDIAAHERPFAPRKYELTNPERLQALAGKQVVVVEDIVTTGSSMYRFVKALRRDGIKVKTVASLTGDTRLDAPWHLVKDLQNTLHQAKMDIDAHKLAKVLSKGELNVINKHIKIIGDVHERANYAEKLRGLLDSRTYEYVGQHDPGNSPGK